MYTGPHIKRDGLVFGYDTGQFASTNPNFNKFLPYKGKSRFFGGKPTINYVSHANSVPQSSYTTYAATTSGTWVSKHPGSIRAYNSQGGDISWKSNSGVGDWTNTYHAYWTYDKKLKKPVVQMNAFDGNWKAKSFGAGMAAWNTLGMSAGKKYVISWDQWTTHLDLRADVGFYSKNTSNGNGFHDGRQSPRNSKTNRWERVHAVYTVSSNRNLSNSYGAIYMYGHTTSNGAGKILKIANVQLELDTDSPSKYIDNRASTYTSSRSSTQSLIDLTKTTNIDVSNVSFDSDGLPTFDGTDDYMQTSLTGINLDSQCTIEGVLQRKSTPTAWRTFFNLKPSGANTPFFEFRSNANSQHIYADYYNGTDYNTNAASFTTGTYGHAVATYDGAGNVNMYFNGELIHTKTGVPSFALGTSPRLIVGRAYSNDRNTDIEAPVVKVYNRALTSQEIKQNFRAYKNRFDI